MVDPVPPVDECRMVVIVDNESDTLSSVDAGVDQMSEVGSLLGRLEPETVVDGCPCVAVFDHLCVACHGLSVHLTCRVGDDVAVVLFDVGPDGDLWLGNAERLDIDLSAIETIFLSHWHADHSGGLPVVTAAVADARRAAGRPAPVIDLHPDRPDRRGFKTPTNTIAMLQPEPSFDDIIEAGGRIELHDEPHWLSHHVYASGMIERVTSYETGRGAHVALRDDTWVSDPLILDERFLAVHVRGRGVSVLSACSHAGIVNVCLAAKAAFPGSEIDSVVGGFHLAGASTESRTEATVRDLAETIRPRLVAPGHCTGWRAKAALAQRFAPGGYGPSAVGTRYRLASPTTQN